MTDNIDSREKSSNDKPKTPSLRTAFKAGGTALLAALGVAAGYGGGKTVTDEVLRQTTIDQTLDQIRNPEKITEKFREKYPDSQVKEVGDLTSYRSKDAKTEVRISVHDSRRESLYMNVQRLDDETFSSFIYDPKIADHWFVNGSEGSHSLEAVGVNGDKLARVILDFFQDTSYSEVALPNMDLIYDSESEGGPKIVRNQDDPFVFIGVSPQPETRATTRQNLDSTTAPALVQMVRNQSTNYSPVNTSSMVYVVDNYMRTPPLHTEVVLPAHYVNFSKKDGPSK